jgi:hypothetical protein
MSRVIGCENAREKIDAFIDEELSVDDQVLVESHLRWCRTCAYRVEDLRLIGEALKLGSTAHQAGDDDPPELAAIQSGVLMRIHAEHEQSLGVRLKDMFSDLRLFWPALGATTALAICVTGASLVLQWSTEQRPESLAAMISTLAEPGSERNPLRPDNGLRTLDDAMLQYVEENRLSSGISIPRALDDGAMFEGIGDGKTGEGLGADRVVYALSTIVSRDGRIANYQVLSEHSGRTGRTGVNGSRNPYQVDAVLADAVRQSRFAPAQTPGGSKVAVNMVWLIISTSAVKPPADAVVEVRQAAPARPPEPVPVPAVVPEDDRLSSTLPLLATA